MSRSSRTGGVAHLARHRRLAAVLAAAAILSAAACTSSHDDHAAGMSGMTGMSGMSGEDMSGMSMGSAPTAPAVADAAPNGTGLASSQGGYTFVPGDVAAGRYTFTITGPDGHPVTRYQPFESMLVVLCVIRSDLSGYQLLDPAMQQDGTWSAQLPQLRAGGYRAFASFAAPDSSQGTPLRYTLSQPFTVPGQEPDQPLPDPATSATADGYTVTWSGQPKAGSPTPLTVAITNGGKPVQHVDRFLDGYVHLTAFHAGDLATAHVLSTGRDTSGTFTATAVFPESGTWRLFAQFVTSGQRHTATYTLTVPPS